MPEALKFDPAAFAGLTNTLRQAAANMTQATAALRDASAEDLGSHGIDNAAKRFQERWSDGINKIAQAAGSMVEGMKQASAAYTSTDADNSDSITTVGSALGGGSSVGPSLAGTDAGRVGSLNLGRDC